MQTSRPDHLDEHVDDVLDPDDGDALARAARGWSATSCSASLSVSPAPISSSSSTTGSVASARASSMPLAVEQPERLGTPVRDLEHAAELERVDAATVGLRRFSVPRLPRPRRRRSRRRSCLRTACGTWCALAMPRRQRCAAPWAVTSASRKRTVPAFGCRRAGEDVQERRLAGAVRADDADCLAGAERRSRRRAGRPARRSACGPGRARGRLCRRPGSRGSRTQPLYGFSFAPIGTFLSLTVLDDHDCRACTCARRRLHPLAARERRRDDVRDATASGILGVLPSSRGDRRSCLPSASRAPSRAQPCPSGCCSP